MRTLTIGFLCLAAALSTTDSANAQPCNATADRSAVRFARDFGGARSFREYLDGPGWTFTLEHSEYGYDIRLYDENGIDLTQMTPPLRGAPNPRQIYGWHFRNKENTGANNGDVNAPQHLRLFGFDPALTGTGGFKPSSEGAGGVSIDDQPGRGGLTIEDMGLADLGPGEKARINYLKFNVCLTWPTTPREKDRQTAAAAALAETKRVTPELLEHMGSCGLDLLTYEIVAYLAPVELGGDVDGDTAIDVATPIIRKSDGKRGLAICRAGTWNHVLGMDGKTLGAHLSPGYFDSIDWWNIHRRGPVGASAGEETPPPTLIGDAITVGKEGASSALIYWDGVGFNSYWQGD